MNKKVIIKFHSPKIQSFILPDPIHDFDQLQSQHVLSKIWSNYFFKKNSLYFKYTLQQNKNTIFRVTLSNLFQSC